MVSRSVNEPTEVINQNQINEVLLKAEALLQIVLNSNFQSEPAYIMHDYLWVLSDLISSARKLMLLTPSNLEKGIFVVFFEKPSYS